MKKIVIATMGSRGDVEPYIALGIELKNLGYDVVVSAPSVYGTLVREHNLEYRELKAVNPQEMMKLPEVEDKFNKGNMVGALVVLMQKSASVINTYLQEMYSNMEGADAVITSMIPYGASDAAEKMNVPMIHTLLNPAVPTKEFPSVIMPYIPKCAYKLSHKALERGFYICFKKSLNQLRKREWKLPKLKRCPLYTYRMNNHKTLLAYSDSIIEKPHDWSKNEVITGFWQIDEKNEYVPSEELNNFLDESGKEPYYIGFGSMPIKDVKHTVSMIDEALEAIDEKAVVYLSYNYDQELRHSERICIVKDVPHSWLFPRVKATVIHGGIGTCRASMMAGKPTLVIPFMGDQEFWGLQLSRIGIGPKPVKLKNLNAQLLSELLAELNCPEYRDKAKEIQKSLSDENGAYKAAKVIDEIMNVYE
ncbi:MAG: glycosyltransferase [Firmicutes bacterium]|nr:glycosyltransferase [Bacillota bacterium]